MANFSKYSILREVCLGVAFTAQSFQHGIIGISYTATTFNVNEFSLPVGGICDRPLRIHSAKYLNCLTVSSKLGSGNSAFVSTFLNLVFFMLMFIGRTISRRLLELSLSHELGHSFGSGHDQTKECEGYLMAGHAPRNYHRHHYHFSSCSKRMIVESIINKGYCLEDDPGSYCGNGKNIKLNYFLV